MAIVHVPGKNVGQIMLYALSTCVWCQKTRKLLEEMGVEYDYKYVDNLQGEEKANTIKDITVWNPSCSFPTIVINNNKCIVGFKESEIRELLKK